jgi:hypothetical protein
MSMLWAMVAMAERSNARADAGSIDRQRAPRIAGTLAQWLLGERGRPSAGRCTTGDFRR